MRGRKRGYLRPRRGLFALSLSIVAAGILGGADRPAARTKDAAPAVDPAAAWVATYICVRVQPGVQPLRLADGSWTLRRAAEAVGDVQAIELQPEERAINTLFIEHGVRAIDPFYGSPFRRPDLAAKYGLDRSYIVRITPGHSNAALSAALADRFPALIERSELDGVGSIAGVPNDPSFSLQWDMHNTGQVVSGIAGVSDADIDAPECWDIHTGSASTIIAVLDTGVQANHPDLNGKVINGVDSVGVNGPPPASWGTDTSDVHGHGTHCAGVAGARGNDGVGVAGTNWNAKILSVRVADSGGNVTQVDLSEAIIWAADNGADVLSMSLQFYSSTTIMESAVAYAYDGGALPIAAGGNRPDLGAGHVAWPGRYAKCMSVAATNNLDVRWLWAANSGSCIGPELDVAAPGEGIYNITRFSGYTTMTGTSMATPHVAGLAGLIMSRNPALTVPQIEAIIRNTAEDKGTAGFDTFYGSGRINLHAALLAAAPPCPADINGNQAVNTDDLIVLITSWGGCGSCTPPNCPADVNHDCVVNTDDLIVLITTWGACP